MFSFVFLRIIPLCSQLVAPELFWVAFKGITAEISEEAAVEEERCVRLQQTAAASL